VTASSWRTLGRALLVIVGLGLVTGLLMNAGPAHVASVMKDSADWLPLVFALELVQIASDVVSLRWLLRIALPVPVGTWVRSSATAYAMMILVPAGRASGEVARGALLARHVGGARAATAAAQLQSSYLFANGALAAAACVVVASWAGLRSPLVYLLAGNTLLMWILSAAILALLRRNGVGLFIERMRRRFVQHGAPSAPFDRAAAAALPWRAALVCTASRSAQVVQYGALVAAVGGIATVRNAFIAHGIHLVGSTAGDLLPNQLGAVDGAYRAFAGALGFADAPARALSIAFLAHAVQLTCAGTCILVAALGRRASASVSASP
jgi:hypothetical protein